MRIGLALLMTGGLLATALWGLPWVQDESGSLAADFAILFLWTLLAFGAAWFQVAVFVHGGEPVTGDEARPGPEAFRTRTVLRSVLVGVAVLGNLVWSDLVAGEFWFSHYSRSGVQATALRSSDPGTRRRAIARIAETADPAIESLAARLEPLLGDGDALVRADAIAAHGHLAWRMRMALKVLQGEGSDQGRFEARVLRAVERALGDPVAQVRSARGPERRAWIFATGAVGDASAIPVLERVCESGEPEEVLAAVDALADIGAPGALPILGRMMTAHTGEAAVHAAWAAGLIMAAVVGRDPAGALRMPEYVAARDAVRSRLAGLEPEAVCAFLRWFPEVADASLSGALVEIARSRTFLLRCARVERARWFGAPEMIVAEGPVADAVLRAMASVAVGNAEVTRFLEEAVGSSRFPDEVRVRLKEMLDAATRAE